MSKYLKPGDPELVALIEALGLDPAMTRRVTIRLGIEELGSVRVDQYLSAEQATKSGEVISRFFYLAKLSEAPAVALPAEPNGAVKVTGLGASPGYAHGVHEWIMRAPWWLRAWRRAKRTLA